MLSLQLKTPYHTSRKSIINISLNALNMFFWLITASKLLQRKSTFEKIESFLLSNPEIGSPLGLVTSRLLSNVEAAEDWAALVGMWTKVGWIPGRKGYKKEKKRMRLSTNFACSYNKEQLSIPKAVVKEGKTRQFLLPSEERLWKNLGKIKKEDEKMCITKIRFHAKIFVLHILNLHCQFSYSWNLNNQTLRTSFQMANFSKTGRKACQVCWFVHSLVSRNKDEKTLW